MVKKFSILMLSILILFSSLILGCSSKPNATENNTGGNTQVQTYEWKFALEEVSGGLQDIYAKKFKELIEKNSNGRVKVNIYYLGQLGDGANQFELVQNGAIQLSFMSTGATGTLVPEANFFSMHFLFPSDIAKAQELMYNSKAINETLKSAYLAKNFNILDWIQEGYCQFTGNKLVKTPSDFKGFKMRIMVSPLIAAQFQAYGADTINMPFAEVYSGLQLGMADGQTNPISLIEEMKFYEVQKYLMMINSELGVIALGSNAQWWDELPDDLKKVVKDSILELRPYYLEQVIKVENERLEKMKETKMEIVEYTNEERDAFRKAARTDAVLNKYIEIAGPNGKTLMDQFFQESESYFK